MHLRHRIVVKLLSTAQPSVDTGRVNGLTRLQADPSRQPVVLGIDGAGFIAKGLLYAMERTPGFAPAVVAARSPQRACDIWLASGRAVTAKDILSVEDPDQLAAAIADDRPAVTSDAGLLAETPGIDVVLEATSAFDHGAELMLSALRNGRTVVSMNAEVDATIGHLLHHQAADSGAVYTICDGDQPGAMLRQLEFVSSIGMDVVAAVNCKTNLDVHQTPEMSRDFAARDGTSQYMTTAFGDGTKMQFENTVVANLSGLIPDCRGMHGVHTTVETAAADITAALSAQGCVEFTLGGDFGAGIGVVGHCDDPEMEMAVLKYLKMGNGPEYFLFRPYHLIHFEVPITVAEAVLDRTCLGTPSSSRVAETITVAKRDLSAGTQLDGVGGFCCYGLMDDTAGAAGLLPMGLSEHARVTHSVAADEVIALDDVELDDSAPIVQLWEQQAEFGY